MHADEAAFTEEGVFNIHNNHVSAEENPHPNYEHDRQDRLSVNVWAGMELLEDAAVDVLRRMWLQQDGAPAHFGRIVREYLDAEFPGLWPGRQDHRTLPRLISSLGFNEGLGVQHSSTIT